MRNLLFTFSLLFITLMISCGDKKNLVDSGGDDGKLSLVIMQINDVYELSPLEGGKSGGLARVEALHKELLAKNPNTLLVHAGDFLNPSLMGTLKDNNGEKVRGKQMIEMMNYMGFDLVAFGNHEFDLKYSDFQKRLNESNFQWIATNLLHVDGDTKKPFYKEQNGQKEFIPSHYTFELLDNDGTKVKLGFVSATINSNTKDYVQYDDFYEKGKLAFRQLKPNTDLILGLTHLKLSEDKLFAGTLPEIPLIMGGHEHENMDVPVGNSRITKADANAKSVYVHYLTIDKNEIVDGHAKTEIRSELVIIDETKEEDSGAALIANKWLEFQETKLGEVVDNAGEVIYQSEVKLDGRDKQIRSVQTNLGKIFAEAMATTYKVDAAFVNGGSIRFDDQLVGDITGVDIFRALPYGGPVLKIKITGSLLSKVLQEGELRAGTGAYLQRHNLEQIYGWQINGKLIEPEEVYEIAISDYLIKGKDIPMLKEDNPGVIEVYRPSVDEEASDIRKVVISFLNKK